jgi:aryl-alcohol dehydrogenase-like predicted oxidoreductase
LNHPSIDSAIIGFGEAEQVDEAVASLESHEPPLDWHDVLAAELACDSQV